MSMSVDTGVSVERVKELEQEVKELTNEIKRLRKCKKYGLVWEDHVEELDKKDVIPLLAKDESLSLPKIPDKPMNYLIEGDNYHALRALQHTHRGRIDVIYIDPPYNTGNEFVYNDKIVDKDDSFRHSKWLSFMNKRLKLARELMSDDGVIFISIDDNEQAQLKLLCDEIFGERNFVANMIWRKGGGKSDSRFLANRKEYVLIYIKGGLNRFTHKKSDASNYKLKDDNGYYQLRGFGMKGLNYTSSLDYPIYAPDGTPIYAGGSEELYKQRMNGHHASKDWCWTLSKEEFKRRLNDGRIVFKQMKGEWRVYYKSYLDGKESPYEDIYTDSTNAKSSQEMKDLFDGSSPFQYAKPKDFIKHLLNLHYNKSAIVLDFFVGSGTTGHAVMELNKEDGGNRSFILCTNNEVSDERVQTYLFEQGFIPKNNKTEFNKYKKNNPEGYQNFLKSPEYESLGIARAVTRERLKRVIEGYTTPKGKKVEALPNNLTYLKTQEFDISREKK